MSFMPTLNNYDRCREDRDLLKTELSELRVHLVSVQAQLAESRTQFLEHTQHVQKFLQEMYAIMVDPVDDATGTVVETCQTLLNAARRDRQATHDSLERERRLRETLERNRLGLRNIVEFRRIAIDFDGPETRYGALTKAEIEESIAEIDKALSPAQEAPKTLDDRSGREENDAE